MMMAVKNKGCMDGSTGTMPTLPSHTKISLPSPGQGVLGSRPRKIVHLVEMERDVLELQDNCLESPVQSPSPGGNMQRKDCLSTSGSSGSSVGSCSRSVSDAEDDRQEEEKGEDKGGVDDWEAVADALSAVGNHARTNSDSLKTVLDSKMNRIHHSDARLVVGATKTDTNRTIPRAWKPDDVARPQCLPNLSKQLSFPVKIERRFNSTGWHRQVIISAPSSCPICVEDFDLTDSSFLPCSCGFRICLFCHKKILEEGDGRCPGCRNKYDRVQCMETSVTVAGLSLPHRISRSCSMNSRS